MGERLHGMQEVSGSIPLTSTKNLEPYDPKKVGHRNTSLLSVACTGLTLAPLNAENVMSHLRTSKR